MEFDPTKVNGAARGPLLFRSADIEKAGNRLRVMVHTHLLTPTNPPQVTSIGTLSVEAANWEAVKELVNGLSEVIIQQGSSIIVRR